MGICVLFLEFNTTLNKGGAIDEGIRVSTSLGAMMSILGLLFIIHSGKGRAYIDAFQRSIEG
jgi:hypothetical protein